LSSDIKLHSIAFVAWELNNYIRNRLQGIGGRSCLINNFIITMNGDMNEELRG